MDDAYEISCSGNYIYLEAEEHENVLFGKYFQKYISE